MSSGRHESLRTTFEAGDQLPIQIVHPTMDLPFQLTDLGLLPANERTTVLDALIRADAQRPFDLATGPLLSARLVRHAADEATLVLVVHHIMWDEASLDVLDHAHLGQVYRFSLPRLTNISSGPLVVISAQVVHIPQGLLTRLSRICNNQASGYPLTQRFDYPATAADPKPDDGNIVVAPGRTAAQCFMVQLQLDNRTKDKLHGCAIDYIQEGKRYTQVMSCHFAISIA